MMIVWTVDVGNWSCVSTVGTVIPSSEWKMCDLRAIDATKIRTELGWSPSVTFDQGIAKTIDWYLANETWWRTIIDGSYRDYYRDMYHGR